MVFWELASEKEWWALFLRQLHSSLEGDFRERNASLRFENCIRIGQKFLLDPSEVQMGQKWVYETTEKLSQPKWTGGQTSGDLAMVGFFWCLRLHEVQEAAVAFVSERVFKVSSHTKVQFLDGFFKCISFIERNFLGFASFSYGPI